MGKVGERSARSVTRISKSTVDALPRPAAGGRGVLWDSEIKGFGVRITSSGVRTYVLRYSMGGGTAPRQLTIGRHGSPWTPDQARRRALELLVEARSGVDPAARRRDAAERRRVEAERRGERMFDTLADRWFERHVVSSGLRSKTDIAGVLERDLKPAFGGRSIDEIDRRVVGEALDAIGDRSQSAANKAHKWLRQMFNWLIEKGVVEHSPVDRVKRPFPEPSRKRALTLLEIVVVWVAAGGLPEPFRSFYRLLLLLGQRLREVANLPWSELDLDAAEWIIPGARTKNKRDHVVPLPAQAVTILRGRAGARLHPTGPVLTTDGRVGISGFSKMKEALDDEVAKVLTTSPEAAARIGERLPDWVVHDARRSLATGCQGMNVAVEVIEAILNHVSGRQEGVRGVYQLYDYFDEKAEALADWCDLIDRAVAAWEAGDVAAILGMDPSRSRHRGRSRRDADPRNCN